jgi:hypothetical protein
MISERSDMKTKSKNRNPIQVRPGDKMYAEIRAVAKQEKRSLAYTVLSLVQHGLSVTKGKRL